MKCPYCGKERQNGFVPMGTIPAQWLPDDRRPSCLKTKYTDGCKTISAEHPLMGVHAKAADCDTGSMNLLKEKQQTENGGVGYGEI